MASVYAQGRRERVAALTHLYPAVVTAQNFGAHSAHLRDLAAIFSTWGMPLLTARDLDRLPALEAVFYAAGSVQAFARPFLERGITVVSAWRANAIPVAEFTLAQIILANKGYWRNTRCCRDSEGRTQAPRAPGNFGETVALLGAGAVGQALIRLLQPFALKVIVYDPFLSDRDTARWGVEKVTLPEAFARGLVVSNHLASNRETVKLLGEDQFRRMREGAVFINTGRGATVDESALIQVLRDRPDLTALLDVADPEPPAPDSPLYTLPNIHLTSHIAGAIGSEVVRMADVCITEFQAWESGELPTAAVTLDMLTHMA